VVLGNYSLTVSSEKGVAATDAAAVTVVDPAEIATADAMYDARAEAKAEVLIRHVANAVVKIIVADSVPNQRASNAVKRNAVPNQEAISAVVLNQEANHVAVRNQKAFLVENVDLNQEVDLAEEDVVVAIIVSI